MKRFTRALGSYVDDALEHWAAVKPEATSLFAGEHALSYGILNEKVQALAVELQRRGVAPGKHVATLLDHGINMLISAMAVLRAGAVLVPVHPRYHPDIVRHILEDAEIRLLISRTATASRIGFSPVLDPDSFPEIPQEPLREAPRRPESLAVLFYTSGSTGRPKGVMISHEGLMHGIDSVCSYLPLSGQDRLGAVLPMSFDAGFNFVAAGLHAGAQLDLLTYVFPRSLADALASRGITGILAVPQIFRALTEAKDVPLPKMQFCASTGGRMDPMVVDELQALMPEMRFWVMYGLTEAFRATALHPNDFPDRRSSIGKPIPHAYVRILREDGTAADPFEPGEIAQTGPLMGLGYWKAPALTAERYPPLPQAFGDLPFEKAVRSGDLGWQDDQGFFYFSGRKDRMIKSRGFRISPEEIEKALLVHAGTGSVYVAGVEDPVQGQRIVAFLETDGRDLPEDASLIAALRPHLSSFMLPDEFRRVQRFPLNSNGKIDGAKLLSIT
ncbi:MAG: AMP-binding protein [Candidatus Sericytochromatia bacterium]|nr:AMP-binding protein [Candidatus Sericytochromatia bacterium]